MTHPEQFGRQPGDYDPMEPLVIAYGDAIAALLSVLVTATARLSTSVVL